MLFSFLGAALFPLVQAWAAVSIPFHFEPNRGQAASSVQYLARVRGASVFLTDTGIRLVSRGSGGAVSTILVDTGDIGKHSPWQATKPGTGTTSYFKGNDPARWIREIPHFQRIERRNLYDGIDLALYGTEGRLEYDFVVSPGADPGRIRLHFRGSKRLTVTPEGDLIVGTAAGELVQKKPVLYQMLADGSRKVVEGGYRLLDRDTAAFRIGAYDRDRTLTIDPVLESATLLGGSGDDRIVSADSNGYIVGTTTSWDFPGVRYAPEGGTDIFCYNPREQSTSIVGGTGDDIVTSASRTDYYVVVGGYTNSRDFPISPWRGQNSYNPQQTQYGGGAWDGFVAVLGSDPVNSTYLGGSGDDRVLAVAAKDTRQYAVAGSTTSTDFPLANAWQSTLGGSTDGFLTLINAYGIYASSYLGGSGDDRALAVAARSDTEFYVAGESRSNGWLLPGAPWNGSRLGASDGFALHVNWDFTTATFGPDRGVWFGGTGEDRVTAAAGMANGNFAVAGVTASADLKAGATTATGTRGGASDFFLASLSSDLKTAAFALVAGGAGLEEPLALATDSYNELLVGGWTDSKNFPQKDPLQANYGGGSADGFLYHTDSEGKVLYSTYYGGSSSDRITAVRLEDGNKAHFGGATESSNLPLKDAVQTVSGGGRDAFYGVLTVPVIHADGVTVGKDLSATALARLGDTQKYIGVPLTITSTDPTRVLVAMETGDAGSASITIADGDTLTDPAVRSYRVYCLADSGSVPVNLTAPGYPARSITVRCVPSGISVSLNEMVVRTTGDGAGEGKVNLATVALDPTTRRVLQTQNPRGGLAVRIDATSSDKNVLVVKNGSLNIDAYTSLKLDPYWGNNLNITFTTKKIGSADLILTANAGFALVPSDRVRVRVTGQALSLNVPRLARDFVDWITIGRYPDLKPGQTIPAVKLTLTSSDESKVRLAASSAEPGAKSVTLDCTQSTCGAYAVVYDASGPVSITASGTGFDPVTVPVILVEANARFFEGYNYQLASVYLTQNETKTAYVRISADLPFASRGSSPMLRAGAQPVSLHMQFSDPSVASVPIPDITFAPGASLWTSVSITGKKKGSAVLSLSLPGRPFNPTMSTLDVSVSAASTQMEVGSISVGYNLQESLVISMPSSGSGAPRAVTVTSSDPSHALLAADAASAGKTSVTLPASYYNHVVYVQALAGAGNLEVTATSAGLQPAKGTVHLVPSGFAWSDETLELTTADTAAPKISGYALDPAKLFPLREQAVRPGATGSLGLVSSDEKVITAAPKSVSIALLRNEQPPVTLKPLKSGSAKISITQPAGHKSPVGHRPLSVKVTLPPIEFYTGSVGKNMQRSASARFSKREPDQSARITFRSGDPARLVLSTSSTDLGSASVTIPAHATSGDSPTIYMQALEGPADVKVTASCPGYEDAVNVVRILPSAVAFPTPSYSSEDPVVRTNTQASPVAMSLYLVALGDDGSSSTTLRPGLGPIAIQVNSSDPKIAIVEKNPVLLNSATSHADFTVKPLAAGKATLTFAVPSGFVPAPPGKGRTATVVVEQPAVVLPDLVLGKDLQFCTSLEAQAGQPYAPKALDVTVTSGDASKVKLSMDQNSSAAETVVLHISANQSIGRTVCAQAQADSGVVPLTISAPGYRTTTSKIKLTRTALVFDTTSIDLRMTDSGDRVQMRPVPADGNQSYYGGAYYRFRQGLASFRIGASTTSNRIATVSPAELTVSAGTSDLEVTVKPAAIGTTTLALNVPAPYIGPATVPIKVEGGSLNLSAYYRIGKNLQTPLTVYSYGNNPPTITLKSPDPTRLLISASPASEGKKSLTVTPQPGQPAAYLQALADSGTVTITASAVNYQDATLTVQLTPSAVVLSGSDGSITPLSAPVTFQGTLASYWSGSSDSYRMSLRGGATRLTVPVALSDAKVASVTPKELVFEAGDSTKTFSFQPLAAGTVLVSVGVPAGFTDPVSERQELVTVSPARLLLTGASAVGKDLRRPTSVRVSDSPGQPVTVTLTSADPNRLLLASSSAPNGSASVSITAPAGGYGQFSLIGLASSGTVTLRAMGTGIPDTTYSIALQPSGFRVTTYYRTIYVGYSAPIDIIPCAVNPLTQEPDGDSALRPGLPAVAVTPVSSDKSVIPAPSAVQFQANDSGKSLSVSGTAPGVATLSATAPGFTTPKSGSATITVQ